MRRVKRFFALLLALELLSGMAFAAGGHPFTDVPDTAWYGDAVQYVYEHDMMLGTDGGAAFTPDDPTSRGMIVTILHRLEGEPSAAGGARFADVPAGQWYAPAVAWACANGIVTGYGDGNFGPDDPVTREQMAAILYRYAGYKGYASEISGNAAAFPDGDQTSPYALDAVNWAVGTGLLRGGDQRLSPAGVTTRAQTAAMLMRLCEDVARPYTLTVVNAMDVMCEPRDILFLEDGAFLVTDTYNKVIWRVEDGASAVYAGGETVADPYGRPTGGYNDGTLEDSRFKSPWAIAPFLDGCAVSDVDNNAVRLLRDGTVKTLGGAGFERPAGLASDEAGNLYVSDADAGTVRKITPEGQASTFVSGLSEPMGLCWSGGTLYIAEAGTNRIVKTEDGAVTVVAGSGEDGLVDGPADMAAFSAPQGVAAGEDGAVYVSDTANGAVRRIQNGVVTTLARRDAGDLNSFIPSSPLGLAVRDGRLYVCDSFARRIFVLSREE